MSEAPDTKTIDWLEDRLANYENTITCQSCDGVDIKVTVGTFTQFKCKSCGSFSSDDVALSNIPAINYNAVSFLQEKKIIEILEAQGKI
jgi:hypothetical protein